MRHSTRHPASLLLSALSTALLSACGDANIKNLTAGIPRDSVLRILGQGSTSSDSTPNVYREERYLANGQMLTVLLYTKTGKEEARDTVPERELTPVVLRNDTLTGWGWTYHDSVAKANNIPLKPPQ